MILRKLLTAIILVVTACSGRPYVLTSPDNNIEIIFLSSERGKPVSHPGISVKAGGKTILLHSTFELKCKPGIDLTRFRIIRTEAESKNTSWMNNFGAKKVVPDNYNQLKIFMAGDGKTMNLIFRAYNEGVAFAYEFPAREKPDSILIEDENIHFRFGSDYLTWSAARAQAQYSHVHLSEIEKGCERPLLIEMDTAHSVAIGEAKLVDYSRMKFYPDTSSQNAIVSRLDDKVYKALPFQSPWRYILIGRNPGDLLEKNYMLLNLNDPSGIKDESWIKPGKVVRETTLTTDGAKRLVDFISAHNMQYIEFDAGWYGYEYSDSSDARRVNVDPKRSRGPLDLQDIISYAHSKNTGVLLYVNRRALERQLDEILPLYSKWGVSGIKFGFVQVGTQPVTAWMHEAIRKAADYKMIIDVHDEYRPTG